MLSLTWLSGLFIDAREQSETAQQETADRRPNILLLVADDLGYNDISAINRGGLATPGIDQLAAEGVIFTRHYADSTCTPSRVAILSGRYAERSGFRPVGNEIPNEFPTIAQRLQESGYRTYLTGKWHAGEARRAAWPDQKGFDAWYGFLNQFELSEAPSPADARGRRPRYHDPLLRDNGGEPVRRRGHLTDILTEHTLRKIQEFEASETPWFIYHGFLAPHAPIQPAQRYRQRFPDTPAGAYAALVTQLDDAVARIVAAVDRSNTLVIFVSDNGGTNAQRDNNYPFFGRKSEVYEGSYRTPLIMRWPDAIPANLRLNDIVMNVDIYPTILAAAKLPPSTGIDGMNLWPVISQNAQLPPRQRSWETFSSNVNSLSFGFLSQEGAWRLASHNGLAPELFNLRHRPNGDRDVGANEPGMVAALTPLFWKTHHAKSTLAVVEAPGASEDQRFYTGFDAMRTPFRYGFAIGLEVGPLPDKELRAAIGQQRLLAGQQGHWELRYISGHGLEWQLGESRLRDPHFEPGQCNSIVLTGYLEPRANLAVRAPRSVLKLYSDGFLRDFSSDAAISALPSGRQLETPTFVNFGGRAVFSNMLLSSFADPYTPEVAEQFAGYYRSAYRDHSLMLADVRVLSGQLCRH
ncbi:MAG: sulfatase-like hydrolase/transferase [Halioglobus sp.]